MSEAHTVPASPATVDAMARLMVRAVLAGKSPAKRAKACRRLADLADDMEEAAHACASVYPIRGGGQSFGQRPADLESRAAARALRTAILAEFPGALAVSRTRSTL